MEMNESNLNSSDTVKKRGVAFNIDLNETPLSSPPRDSGNLLVLAPPPPVPVPGGSSKGKGKGKGKGKAVIDMNAFPTEVERDESGNFLNSVSGIQGASFNGNWRNGPVTSSNLLSLGNGNRFDLTGAPGNATTLIKPMHMDNAQLRPNFYRNVNEVDIHSLFRGRGDYPLNTMSLQNQSEVHLDNLRKFILQNHGRILEDDWRVEFYYCQNRCTTCVVYCSPDGNKFESMIDVARYLSLVSNYHSLGSPDTNRGLSLEPNWSRSYGRKNESSVFSRMKNFNECQGNLESSLPVRISLGLENGNVEPCNRSNVTALEATANSDSSHLKDVPFPIQFDDFFVLSLGELDPRSAYHTSNRIWPVGYRSSWHDKITGSLFVCDISDGGDCGPIFKVHRYPCTARSIPIGSTVLSRPSLITENKKKERESPPGINSDEDTNFHILFSYHSPPRLDLSADEASNSSVSKDHVKPECDSSRLGDGFGEFLVEARSSSMVWKMVSEKLVHFCQKMYKKNGLCTFCCKHSFQWCSSCTIYYSVGSTAPTDSLTKFCHVSAPFDINRGIESNDELSSTCEALGKWLGQDRFGLDVDFVQELIERNPGVHSFSDYTVVKNRINKLESQTVENGSLLAKRTSDAQYEKEANCIIPKKKLVKYLCPPGKPLGSKLPTALVSDVLQSWELLWRFSDVLGLEQTLSFEELEEELTDSGSFSPRSTYPCGTKEMQTLEELAIMRQVSTNSGCSGEALYKAHCSLLKVLLEELRSKLAVFADPVLESGESSSRKRNNLIFSGKPMFDLLPVNELTWPELVRRYFLIIASMESNFDFPEITSRESCKVFRGLQGDGGVLYGPLPGVAVLEADALLLAEAMNRIFGSSKSIYDTMNVELSISVAISPSNEVKVTNDASVPHSSVPNASVPEWAKELEPVRKLPTNVGARIRKCVNAALEKNPPEWAVEILEHSISKEVYKGNASGPTKRAVVALLSKLSGETYQPKFVRRRKLKQNSTLSDVIMRQCRIVLRSAAQKNEEKVLYNLLGRTLLNTCDNNGDGLIGFPAMVSRPLDFRTIDLRLVFGIYRGSHEAFLDDVREVWKHIREAYADQTHLLNLVEKFSQKFERLYENEVLPLVQQLREYTRAGCITSETKKNMEDLLQRVSVIPEAPWEDGVCNVCGVDKEDDICLLCDKCNSGYHIFCLDPPLSKIPEGDWYCPSCITKYTATISPLQDCDYSGEWKAQRHLGEFTHAILESLARLIMTMEVKDYWEYSVEERIFLFKFLGDEVLNSSRVRENLEQCASLSEDLQHKLQSLSTELGNLKVREEVTEETANISGSGNQRIVIDLESDNEESVIENKMSELQDSIACVELQLQKVALKKECLGKDSSGRLYWVFLRPGSSPWVIVDWVIEDQSQIFSNNLIHKSSLTNDICSPNVTGLTYGFPVSSQIYFYQSKSAIEELINWLRVNDLEQKELIDSLLHCLIYGPNSPNGSARDFQETVKNNMKPDGLKTRALMTLEKNYGPCAEPVVDTYSVKWMSAAVTFGGTMWRCKCLEPLWASRQHCYSCHLSFSTKREIDEHRVRNCTPEAHKVIDDVSKGKGAARMRKLKSDNAGQRNDYKRSVGCSNDMTSPYKLEEISDKFSTKSSNKELVREIGLLGSNGVPSWVPSASPYLVDPTLKLTAPLKDDGVNQAADDCATEDIWSQKAAGKSIIPSKRCVRRCSSSKNYTALDVFKEIEEIGRSSDETWLKSGFSRPGNDVSVVHDFSVKPVAGKGAQILRQLKISLLDMEAALPIEAVKSSTTNSENRSTWRAFVKSAKSIFEMVQATIVFEYMIKTEFLRKEWWYWSSISAAGKIATISSLALKIYTLDAAIIYEPTLRVSPKLDDNFSSAHTDLPFPNPTLKIRN
ncbi:methyl-CPG-binding domain 9 [Euphorbia peplus]|nr:methyl-CPG-binding domain 9 [Euphorbia peplus]